MLISEFSWVKKKTYLYIIPLFICDFGPLSTKLQDSKCIANLVDIFAVFLLKLNDK